MIDRNGKGFTSELKLCLSSSHHEHVLSAEYGQHNGNLAVYIITSENNMIIADLTKMEIVYKEKLSMILTKIRVFHPDLPNCVVAAAQAGAASFL